MFLYSVFVLCFEEVFLFFSFSLVTSFLPISARKRIAIISSRVPTNKTGLGNQHICLHFKLPSYNVGGSTG